MKRISLPLDDFINYHSISTDNSNVPKCTHTVYNTEETVRVQRKMEEKRSKHGEETVVEKNAENINEEDGEIFCWSNCPCYTETSSDSDRNSNSN